MSRSSNLICLLDEIKVEPQKPTATSLGHLDSIADKIELELKVDGIRAFVYRDFETTGFPDYRVLSSSGARLGGNFKNLVHRDLKKALDQGWVFSGEIHDAENPDNRGQALSVAKNFSYPPERVLFIAWNAFKITPEMQKKGVVTPDAADGLPPYKEMRLNLLKLLRVLKPKQVKIVKRLKMTKDMTPSKIFAQVMASGGEGIVAKLKTGGQSWKIKGTSYFVMPLKGYEISSAKTIAGLVQSLNVETPFGKTVTVGQGYTVEARRALTAYLKSHGTDNLWVGFYASKPTKPLEQGGSPTNPAFAFLSDDDQGKNKIIWNAGGPLGADLKDPEASDKKVDLPLQTIAPPPDPKSKPRFRVVDGKLVRVG